MGRDIVISSVHGNIGAWRADPPTGEPPRGAVVVVQEVFGVNEHIRSVVERYAARGLAALAPALFDPVSPLVELGYDAEGLEKGRGLAAALGLITIVIGLPFVLMPGVTKSILGPTVDRLQAHSDLGKALSTYVMDDGLSGRFILMGVLTIMVAVVGHLARRAGQRRRDDGHGPRD